MKVSVSLPDDDVEFLDAYAQPQGIESRSAVVHKAIRIRPPPAVLDAKNHMLVPLIVALRCRVSADVRSRLTRARRSWYRTCDSSAVRDLLLAGTTGLSTLRPPVSVADCCA
jgi:hypothetical protein